MKSVPPGLAAHLAGSATTLAHLWRLVRRDGTALGFTDHDRPLVVDGLRYEAATGLAASEDVAAAGLSVGGQEIAGALVSAAISEADIAAGRYDGATVDVWLVDWRDPSERLHLRSGVVGEVVEADGAFRAEIRSAAHRLDEPRGRLFQHRCDAELGDARCGVDMTLPGRRRSGTVVAPSAGRLLTVAGLDAAAPGSLERGRLAVLSGSLAGTAFEVKSHRVAAGAVELELWQTPSADLAPGTAFTVEVGCDKLFSTCRDVFANAANFRGFPHMPGSDFVYAHPSRSRGARDGKALVR